MGDARGQKEWGGGGEVGGGKSRDSNLIGNICRYKK